MFAMVMEELIYPKEGQVFKFIIEDYKGNIIWQNGYVDEMIFIYKSKSNKKIKSTCHFKSKKKIFFFGPCYLVRASMKKKRSQLNKDLFVELIFVFLSFFFCILIKKTLLFKNKILSVIYKVAIRIFFLMNATYMV